MRIDKFLRVFLFGLLLSGTVQGAVSADAEKVKEVKAGRLAEAHAVWWGFSAEDATRCLQDALNSGAKKVIVDNMGKDWIITPVFIPSNMELVFKDGVTVRAKKGEFKGRRDSLFQINGQKNVIIRGEGQVHFTMNRKDYDDKTLYTRAEWRHTLCIVKSENVHASNLTMTESGGDGVYVGEGNNHIHLENLICDRHYRQGISITGGMNITVRNCKFMHTKGNAPQCGLDMEPNRPLPGLINILFENCEFSGNTCAGIQFTDFSSVRVRAEFRNCVISKNRNGLNIGDLSARVKAEDPGKGYLRFINCKFLNNIEGNVYVGHHRPNIELVFRDCFIDNRGSRSVAMQISSRTEEDIDQLEIKNLSVVDDEERLPLVFVSRFGNALKDPKVDNIVMKNSRGKIIPFNVEKFIKDAAPNPAAKNFKTEPVEPQKVLPVSSTGKRFNDTIRFREKAEYCVYAKNGDEIKIRFISVPVFRWFSKRYGSPHEVSVSTPTIRNTEKFRIPFDKDYTYVLKATETGLYRFAINARMQSVCIECDAPGQGMYAAEPLYIIWSSGEFYLAVPPGTDDIHISANGNPHEPATVYLIDPNGKIADSCVKSEGEKILTGKKLSAAAEIWKIRFHCRKLFLRVGKPVLPILFTSPENMVVPQEHVKLYTPEMMRNAVYNNQHEFIPNGNFASLSKDKDGKVFATGWNTKKAMLKLEDGKAVGMALKGMIYRSMSLPDFGGRYTCMLTTSGTGKIKVMFRTGVRPVLSRQTKNQKPELKMRQDAVELELNGEKKEFSFPYDFADREKGYIYLVPLKGTPVIHSVKMRKE